MSRSRFISLYWWAPARTARSALWELRSNRRAWGGMMMHGGRPVLQNFGDELSRTVVAEVSGRRVRWASAREASVTAIGSVLEHVADADGQGVVWGSGLRRPDLPPVEWAARQPSRFLAVRGALTRDALGLDPATPLGDPGLLVRAWSKQHQGRRTTLVLPHFLAFKRPDIRSQLSAARSLGMKILAPSASHERVREAVARSDLVLTSSLHAMVMADALGRPVQFVAFGATAEPAFKFADYLSVYGLPVDFRSFEDCVRTGAWTDVRERAIARGEQIASQIDDVVEGLARSGAALAALD